MSHDCLVCFLFTFFVTVIPPTFFTSRLPSYHKELIGFYIAWNHRQHNIWAWQVAGLHFHLKISHLLQLLPCVQALPLCCQDISEKKQLNFELGNRSSSTKPGIRNFSSSNLASSVSYSPCWACRKTYDIVDPMTFWSQLPYFQQYLVWHQAFQQERQISLQGWSHPSSPDLHQACRSCHREKM